MEFAFNDDQQDLKKGARRFLEAHSPSEKVRKTIEGDGPGYDEAVWSRIGTELLWPALAIPEAYGGYGFGFVELAAIFEETGRALLPSPLFTNVALATQVILEAGSEEQKGRLLPALAASTKIVALAHLEPGASWSSPGQTTTLMVDGENYSLSGTKRYVLWGHVADQLLVSAIDSDSARRVLVVDARADGVSIERLPTLDITAPMAEIRFENVSVIAADVLDGVEDLDAALNTAFARAAILLACEQVGAAEACLDMAVDYAKTRVQFGKPIGAFQAIKHKCADMMLLVESSRSAAYYAAWAVDHEPSEVLEAASVAQSYCSPALFSCAAENIQIHGGIGITWEHDSQLYFKRAKAAETLLGTASLHNERLLDIIL